MKLWVKISAMALALMSVAMVVISVLLVDINTQNMFDRAKEDAVSQSMLFSVYSGSLFSENTNDNMSNTAKRSIAQNVIESFLMIYSYEGNFSVYYNDALVYNDSQLDFYAQDPSIPEREYTIYEYLGNHYIVIYNRHASGIEQVFTKDISGVFADIEAFTLQAVLINVVVLAVATLLLIALLKITLRPLKKLEEGSKQISRGIYDVSIDVRTKDELADVANSFNDMAIAVNEKIAQIQKTSRELEELSEKRRVFIANLTHEIKTPMTSIIGYSDALLNCNLGIEHTQKSLMFLNTSCKRLERLSQKLMNILVAENYPPEPKNVDVSKLLSEVSEVVSGNAQEKGVNICVVAHVEHLLCDEDLMVSAISNLAANAVKASEQGDEVKIDVYYKEGKIIIEVCDEGKGIAESEIDKIMKPFYKSEYRSTEGVGLGLFLVHTICKIHGADFEISSTLGEGTIAKIIL